MNDIDSKIIETLRRDSQGLLCMSESDYPFEVFLWETLGENDLTIEKILQQTGHPTDAPVKVVELDYFFRHATQEQDWHGEKEKEDVHKNQKIVETLKSQLSDIKVYRLGTIDIDVYIVGKTASGKWAGISTRILET